MTDVLGKEIERALLNAPLLSSTELERLVRRLGLEKMMGTDRGDDTYASLIKEVLLARLALRSLIDGDGEVIADWAREIFYI